jgi:hypothetical protein
MTLNVVLSVAKGKSEGRRGRRCAAHDHGGRKGAAGGRG